jgi:hypothetical protein
VRAACAFSLRIGTSTIRTAANSTAAVPRVAARLLDKYGCDVLKIVSLLSREVERRATWLLPSIFDRTIVTLLAVFAL